MFRAIRCLLPARWLAIATLLMLALGNAALAVEPDLARAERLIAEKRY